jgi:hypothetical protein
VTSGTETWTMTTEETNAVRIFERNIVRKIYKTIKASEGWGITNKEIKTYYTGKTLQSS